MCTAAAAWAAPPQVIYSTIASSPTSNVPGIAGARFQSFSRPYRSDNTRFWIMRADTDLAATQDGVILKGSGLSGAAILQEGDATHWAPLTQTIESFREQMGINDDGHYAFSVNLGGSAPTTADEMIVQYTGTFSIVAQEGGPVPGIAGEAYGTTLDSVSITNADVVAFRAPLTIGGQPDATDEFLILGGAVLAQEGVHIPAGLFGGPQAWDNFDAEDFTVSANGAWIAQGDVLGDTTRDKVVARNGTVVMQEGRTHADLPAPFDAILAAEIAMAPEGSWMARGETTNDLEDFVIHDGEVVVRTGSLVPFGFPGENFSEAIFDPTFFSIASNGFGHFLYGGVTDYVDPNRNAVLVWNDEMLFLREGDGVDVNGDGLANDGAVISVFNNDDVFVGDDGWVYFTADLQASNGSGPLGQAYLRVLAPICRGDMNCDGIVDFFDIDPLVLAFSFPGGVDYPLDCYWLAGDCDEDGDVDFFDIDPFVNRLGQPCIPIP